MKRQPQGTAVGASRNGGEIHALQERQAPEQWTLCGRNTTLPQGEWMKFGTKHVTCQHCVKRINKGQRYLEEQR